MSRSAVTVTVAGANSAPVALNDAITIDNGALTYVAGREAPDADATLTVARTALDRLITRRTDVAALLGSGEMTIEGDAMKLAQLFGLLDPADPSFPIVTP